MALEDIIRDRQRLASEQNTRVSDLTNKSVTRSQVIIVSQAIGGLPAPVNIAARALGEGLFAAFNVPVNPIRHPASSDEDTKKLMAYTMAFAILKAMWCFIKSILNPLPIIGSFFSLCSNGSDTENIVLNTASSAFDSVSSNSSINIQDSINIQQANNVLNNLNRNIPTSSEMSSGETGITFEQFVARTATAASNPNIAGTDTEAALRGQTAQGQTTANLPVQPAANLATAEWQATEKSTEASSYESYRRLFGL